MRAILHSSILCLLISARVTIVATGGSAFDLNFFKASEDLGDSEMLCFGVGFFCFGLPTFLSKSSKLNGHEVVCDSVFMLC